MSVALAETRARQRRWLKRGRAADASWRPRKRFRVSAYRWLQGLDSQLEQAMDVGLGYFAQPKKMSSRGHWSTWPVLSISADCGSDGLSGYNAAARSLMLNVDFVPDESHLCWRAIIAALKATNLWVFVVTTMLAANTPHGPWADDLRHRLATEAMRLLLEHERPQTCPLFMSMVGDMGFDLAAQLQCSEDDLAQSVWDYMKVEAPWERKGTTSNVNGFLSAILQGSHSAHLCSVGGFIYSFIVLELDMVSSVSFKKVVLGEQAKQAGNGPTHMSSGAEKALRAACANQMVVAW